MTTTVPESSRASAWRSTVRPLTRPEFLTPLILLAPALVLMALIIVYPLISGFYLSLTDGSLIKAGDFVGLDNYVQLLQSPTFHQSLRFSILFAIANVVGCYLLGLGLAMLMQLDIPGRAFLRIALLLPWIVPSLVAIVSWRWMVADQNALFNQLIMAFGGKPIFFLSEEGWAIFVVILIKIWRSFPFMMLTLLAALQTIDRHVYEAAAIDGANRWQTFLYVTLPHIKNVSIVNCLLMTIWTVNDFDTPWLLGQGGPAGATENLVIFAYRYTFARNSVGMGAAVSFLTLAMLLVLVVFMLRQLRRPSA